MPNRIIKESIWTSPNLNQLSDLAERHFYRILVLPDDFGCCEVTPLVVKGRCYPLKSGVTIENIDAWQQELEDNNLIIRWDDNGRQYALFPSFDKHQRIRSLHQRKTPAPPDDVMSRLDVACRQMTTNDRLNPNPILNLNPNQNLNHTPLNPPVSSISQKLKETNLVLDAYKKNILLDDQATISEDIENELKIACGRYSPEWVYDAIKEAVLQNHLNWPYIVGILRHWQRYGKGVKFTKEGQ